ncbi:hypothetical protein [Mucilaginibacter sp.]|uniref:hypothetical protein n=1 Tax=Mucilaginibacter sp. TaxID=1882438 RepID=UPI0035BBE659
MNGSNGVYELAERARKEKKWLFDTGFKKWYSPDEFYNTFSQAQYSLITYLQGVKLRDPFEGIEAANQEICKLQKNVEGFTARVLTYYREKAVDKKLRDF